MRKGGLRYEIWRISAFGAPILESRTETMDCDVIADLTQLPGHCHYTDRPRLPHPRKNEIVLPDLSHLLEDSYGLIGQGHTVLPSWLHTVARYRPHALFKVDLVPARAYCLARARNSENQKLERSCGDDAMAHTQPLNEIWQLAVRNRRIVPHDLHTCPGWQDLR